MKKLFLAILVMSIAVFGLASCGEEKPFIGDWKFDYYSAEKDNKVIGKMSAKDAENGDSLMHMKFNDDGTGVFSAYGDEDISFEWYIDKDTKECKVSMEKESPTLGVSFLESGRVYGDNDEGMSFAHYYTGGNNFHIRFVRDK